MKILITGVAGFLGFEVLKKLAEKEHLIHGLDVIKNIKLDNEFSEFINMNINNFKYKVLNVNNGNEILDLDKDYDLILHFAGILGVENVSEYPFKTLYENSHMCYNILELAKNQKKLKKFFFTSTSEVYAGTNENFNLTFPTPENSPLSISDLNENRTSYMLSKIWCEALIKYSNIPYYIFRPHNLYGPRMGMRHVIPQLLKKISLNVNNVLEVFSPNHTRAFCFIDDAVKFIEICIDRFDNSGSRTFNLGNSHEEISMYELSKLMLNLLNKNLHIKKMEATIGSTHRRCPDMKKLEKFTNYSPNIDLKNGILKTFDWYKKNEFLK